MEDAATAEISRAQVWQWIRHGAALDDGRVVTRELVHTIVADEMRGIVTEVGEQRFAGGRYAEAKDLFLRVALADVLPDFLTLDAYQLLTDSEAPQ
jgi:malate synthase